MSFRMAPTINAISSIRFCIQNGTPTGSIGVSHFIQAVRPLSVETGSTPRLPIQEGSKQRPKRYRTSLGKESRKPKTSVAPKEQTKPTWEIEPDIPYEPEELVPGLKMLQRIVAEQQKKGTTFVLPTTDDSINLLLEPFRLFIARGVRPQFILSACIESAKLFEVLATHGKESVQIIKLLTDTCQLTFEDSIRFFAGYGDALLECGYEGVLERIESLIRSGVPAGKLLGRMVCTCPSVLSTRSAEEMGRATEALADFFSRKEISAVLQKCPQILLMNIEEVAEKYEYIYYQMCIEGNEFPSSSKWPLLSLEEIICRHEFLMKAGRYTTPDPKQPQAKLQNPELHRIFDSSDHHFANQVAGVTTEEWIVYRAFSSKWAELSNKDRPFERIKPSMRKAFERRRKHTVNAADHVFGETTHSE